jgi:hypothetical protein
MNGTWFVGGGSHGFPLGDNRMMWNGRVPATGLLTRRSGRNVLLQSVYGALFTSQVVSFERTFLASFCDAIRKLDKLRRSLPTGFLRIQSHPARLSTSVSAINECRLRENRLQLR